MLQFSLKLLVNVSSHCHWQHYLGNMGNMRLLFYERHIDEDSWLRGTDSLTIICGDICLPCVVVFWVNAKTSTGETVSELFVKSDRNFCSHLNVDNYVTLRFERGLK